MSRKKNHIHSFINSHVLFLLVGYSVKGRAQIV